MITMNLLRNKSFTIDIGILDVDGFGSGVVSRGERVMNRTEDLQHSFSQTGLEHHTAATHTYILTAWVQVRDTDRHYRHTAKRKKDCKLHGRIVYGSL